MSTYYCVGSRVNFRSSSNKEKTFTGVITGYTPGRSYAFIRDDGTEKPRPVAPDRIIGLAAKAPPIAGPGPTLVA